jgi:hypothetical protein
MKICPAIRFLWRREQQCVGLGLLRLRSFKVGAQRVRAQWRHHRSTSKSFNVGYVVVCEWRKLIYTYLEHFPLAQNPYQTL